jgi:predicted lipoprotein with Yx(FWY)xxD motif
MKLISKNSKIALKLASYAFLLPLLTVVFTSCKKETPAVVIPPKDLTLATTSLGSVLTDNNGKALYFFSNDIAGGSQCTGGCLTNWPVYFKASPTIGLGLAATDFGTITRSDGTQQSTYKNWPIYYFAGDQAIGDLKGENVGQVWFAAKPSYSLFVGNTQLVGNDGKNYLGDYTEGVGKTKYLMDSTGRTLYAFKPDKKNANTYTKADFSNDATWPIVQMTDLTNLPTGYAAADFTIIDVFGKKQLSYKGHPLYYFGPDAKGKGVTKGVSVPKPGIWPIVNSDTPALQ